MKYEHWKLRYKISLPVIFTLLASNMSLFLVFELADNRIGKVIVPKNQLMENIRVTISSLNNECREYIISAEEETLEEIDEYFEVLDHDLGQLLVISKTGETLAHDIKKARLMLQDKIQETIKLRDSLEAWSEEAEARDQILDPMVNTYLDAKQASREAANQLRRTYFLLKSYSSETRTFISFPEDENEDRLESITTELKGQLTRLKDLIPRSGGALPDILQKCEDKAAQIGKGVIMGSRLATLLEEIEALELSNKSLLGRSRQIIINESRETFQQGRFHIILLISLALLVVSLCSWQVARTVGNALDHLTRATRKFNMDQLDYRVNIGARDEIGALANSFNQMADELEKSIRARINAENELVRKERLAAIGKLTATVSHELRNPMGAIRTSLAVIKKISAGNHKILNNSLEIADRSICRCDTIISDLLGFARVRKLERKSTVLAPWLDEILQELDIPPEIKVQKQIDPKLAWSIDPDYFRRAVLNVVQNGVHALEEDKEPGKEKTLFIKVHGSNDLMQIKIEDTGCGIKPEAMDQIFEPLYSNKNFGTGLGLPTVKQIIRDHGGRIEVNSTWKMGTEVAMWLPSGEA